MKRSILSTAVWLALAIDRRTWEVVEWNLHEIGLRETVATLIEEQACMVDGAIEGLESWDDLYYC